MPKWGVQRFESVRSRTHLAGHQHLDAHQTVALALETGNDLRHQAPVHAVRFDGDEGLLLTRRGSGDCCAGSACGRGWRRGPGRRRSRSLRQQGSKQCNRAESTRHREPWLSQACSHATLPSGQTPPPLPLLMLAQRTQGEAGSKQSGACARPGATDVGGKELGGGCGSGSERRARSPCSNRSAGVTVATLMAPNQRPTSGTRPVLTALRIRSPSRARRRPEERMSFRLGFRQIAPEAGPSS